MKPEVRCWKKGNLSESRGITLALPKPIYLLSFDKHTHTECFTSSALAIDVVGGRGGSV